MTKDQLNELITGLTPADLVTLRAIINGKLSKRTLTKDQADRMNEAKKAKKGKQP
jgi:hypothetical protein